MTRRPNRRRRTRGAPVLLFACLLGALAAAAFWTVQPFVLRRRPESTGPRAAPERLARDVKALARTHGPRDHTHPGNLFRVSEDIAASLRQAGAAVRFQEVPANGQRYRNVVATVGPDSAQRIVIGAHYDTDGPFPGADDNASGVAGLLELARLLDGRSLETRVELVAYALEEMPFFGTDEMGSAVHALSLRRQGVEVRAMLSLEMIGYFSDRPGSQLFPFSALRLFYPDRGDFLAIVGRPRDGLLVRRLKRAMRSSGGIPIHSINAPRAIPGIDLSDHASFWRFGYPAVMITDTAFYRNPHYHTAEDTPQTLDYERMAAVVDALHEVLLDLAGDAS